MLAPAGSSPRWYRRIHSVRPTPSRFDASSTRPSSRGVTLSAKLTDAWWSILAANAREHRTCNALNEQRRNHRRMIDIFRDVNAAGLD